MSNAEPNQPGGDLAVEQMTTSMTLPGTREDPNPSRRDRLDVEQAPQGKITICTIPNALSLGRLILGLWFPWLPLSWQLPVVVVAALTDLLDGTSGRLFGACSRLGRVLDPLADKVFVTGVVTALLGQGVLSVGEVVLIGLRDLTVIIGTAVGLAWRPWAFRRLAPTLLGKATTVAQFIFFVVLLVIQEHKGTAFAVTATLSALAAGYYIWLFFRQPVQETSDVPRS
jgi:phosphatidylglycerophosphate synthase